MQNYAQVDVWTTPSDMRDTVDVRTAPESTASWLCYLWPRGLAQTPLAGETGVVGGAKEKAGSGARAAQLLLYLSQWW